jgi:hypothetical protein
MVGEMRAQDVDTLGEQLDIVWFGEIIFHPSLERAGYLLLSDSTIHKHYAQVRMLAGDLRKQSQCSLGVLTAIQNQQMRGVK